MALTKTPIELSSTQGIVDNSNATAITIDSSENVGIGTGSPSANTEIRGSASNGQLRLGGSTTATYANIYSDNDGVLVLGADAGNNAASSYFGVEVDGTERMRIDSSGDLIVGGTSSGANDAVSISNTGYIQAIVNGDTVGYFNRRTSDGEILRFQKDGTTVGSIGAEGGNLYIDGNAATGKTGIEFLGSAWYPRNDGSNSDGAVDLGDSSNRFKDLYLSGAVNLTNSTTTAFTQVGSNMFQLGTNSADPTVFYTSGAERARIDASGNLLVGKDATSQTTAGTVLYNNGQAYSTASGTQASVLTRLSNDGPIQIFYKDSSEVGRIFTGHNGSQIGIGINTTGITFNPNTRSMMPANPSSTSPQLDATLDIGYSSVRWRDLYLSGGVYLGGTGSANKLDDYEEGTWTPFLDASSTDPSLSYSTQVGAYEKIGALVHASFFINVSAVNSQGSGQLRIAGLPFNAAGNVNASEVPAVLLQTEPFNAGDGTGYQQYARTNSNSNLLVMGYKTGNGSASIPAGASHVGTGYLIGHIVYKTDA